MGISAIAISLAFVCAWACSSGAPGGAGNLDGGPPASSDDAGGVSDAHAPGADGGHRDGGAANDGGGGGGGGDAGADADAGVDAGSPAVRWIGRFELDDAGPEAEWTASAMEARFAGSSVSANLGGTGNFFEVVVDGVVQSVLETDGGTTYPLASGLSNAAHDVVVFRRDEPGDGPATFAGFDLGDAGVLLPPSAPVHRIEVIGDSITCGYGDECDNASENFTPATENGYLAYGPLTARALGADVHVVAWSGKGMYVNLDGTMTETVPILWERTIPTDPTSTWNPSFWIPDAVVINLGTNDYGTGTDPSAGFESTYLAFVTHLKSVYPNVYVFACVGPMLADPDYTDAKTAITNVIAALSEGGDPRMQLVEFPTEDCGTDGSNCGCAYHPKLAEHQTMATILEGAMHAALGW